MDTIGSGEDGEEEPSWLGSILQGVLSEADLEEEEKEEQEGEEEIIEEDLDYVEPPFLDPRLGGADNSRALVRRRRATLTETGKQNQTREEENFKEEERSCTVELWRCLAQALEPAVRQIETSGSIAR